MPRCHLKNLISIKALNDNSSSTRNTEFPPIHLEITKIQSKFLSQRSSVISNNSQDKSSSSLIHRDQSCFPQLQFLLNTPIISCCGKSPSLFCMESIKLIQSKKIVVRESVFPQCLEAIVTMLMQPLGLQKSSLKSANHDPWSRKARHP